MLAVHRLWDRLYWTYHSIVWGFFKVPMRRDAFMINWEVEYPARARYYQEIAKTWAFLEPFFSFHGYTLFCNPPGMEGSGLIHPPPIPQLCEA